MPFPTNIASSLYLWIDRTLYIGAVFELESFMPAASSLMFGLEKPFRIRDAASADFVETRSVLIPAGVPVEAQPNNQLIAWCYLDPLGRDFSAFKTQMRYKAGRLLYESAQETEQLQQFDAIYRTRLPAAQAYQVLLDNIFPPLSIRNAVPPVREAIIEAVQVIHRDPISNISNQELARQVCMSEKQLQREFKKVTGVTVGRYRTRHRLLVTAIWAMQGKTLTDAALAAGFSDSSHFTHMFRSVLGIKPSTMLKRRDSLSIYSEDNLISKG